MDTLQAIATRRSVRTFTGEDISDEVLEQLLRAGMQAPSAGNAQPWEFVVLRDRALLEEVSRINEYAAFAPKAALGILVCGNMTLEKFPGYWIEDTSAAVQNILLAAHSLSLGAVWTGVYPTENRVTAMRDLIKAPDYIIPMGLIIVGHPKAIPAPVDRFKKERVHTNTW